MKVVTWGKTNSDNVFLEGDSHSWANNIIMSFPLILHSLLITMSAILCNVFNSDSLVFSNTSNYTDFWG